MIYRDRRPLTQSTDHHEDSGVYLALLLVTIWLLAEIGLPLLDHIMGGH